MSRIAGSDSSDTNPKTFRVDMQPVGRRIEVKAGMSLLAAAQAAGVGIIALCGGKGWCQSCRVRPVSGRLSPPTEAESDLAPGYRLACQALPRTDVKIDIPPDSLTTPQRLQVEGQELSFSLDPAVTAVDLALRPPDLHDLRADTARLEEALAGLDRTPVRFGLPLLAELSDRLRALSWSVRVALSGDEVVAVLPPGSQLLGLAVDIGTTKVAAYLLDLADGKTLAKAGAMNPQIGYGEDVISRIAYTREQTGGRRLLQARLAETLNELVEEMCRETGAVHAQVVEAVMVGNTAMHHLLAGLPVQQLAMSPYVPAISRALQFRARDIGLKLASGAAIHLLPNIAGYVGADHVAALLAAGIWQTERTALLVDIGTNTEISLACRGRLLSCSCASGPAFEGAHIRDGMRAAPGAIEHVQIAGDQVRTYTIGGEPPVGLCGSGILDAIAQMRAGDILDNKGQMRTADARVRRVDGKRPEFVLVPAEATGHGRDICVTRQDVNEIQLAKGAIRAGLEILLVEAGITAGDVEEFFVAGAFGTYIDLASAVGLGMFPDLPLERFRQVGNAAGIGAKQTLLSLGLRRTAAEIARRVEYIELTTHPAFQAEFMKAMYL